LLKLRTKYFGEIEYEPSESIQFPAGLFGFEEGNDFLLLPFEGGENRMLCLQSTKTPSLAFTLLDPFYLCPQYTPVLQKSELQMFDVDTIEALCFYVLCAVKEPVSSSTVNLKCPVVINPTTGVARQIIMETDSYTMRQSLDTIHLGKGEPGC